MLGDLIATLEDPGAAEEMLVETGDLMLLARVRSAAEHLGVSVGEYCSIAVPRFLNSAGDEEWLQLVGEMNRSETPGLSAVHAILARATGAQVEAA